MLSGDKEDKYIYITHIHIYIYITQITILGMKTMATYEMKSAPEGLTST